MLWVGGWVYVCAGRGYGVREKEICVFRGLVFVCRKEKAEIWRDRCYILVCAGPEVHVDTGTLSFHISSLWAHSTWGQTN